jgi:hypothetical protein
MRKRAIYAFNFPPVAPWLPVALSLWEMSVAAPQVIALRGARMLNAGATPSLRDQREFVRMFEEKAEAMAESMTAMSLQWLAMNQSFAISLLRVSWYPGASWWQPPRVKHRRHDLPRLVSRGIAPVRKRVTANALRLGRVKR